MAFVPLSDRTSSAFHVDNTSRNARSTKVVSALPTYKATLGSMNTTVTRVASSSSSYVHKPYAASVLPELFYSTPLVEPLSSLNVSAESASTPASCSTPVAKTPIRRMYLNGRPVPVFADAPNTSVDSASSE